MNLMDHQLNWTLMDLTKENYQLAIALPYTKRPIYNQLSNHLEYTQVFGIISGVTLHKEDYLNELFSFVYEAKTLQLIGGDYLNKQIDNSYFQKIQKILNIHQEQQLSVNRFVAFLDGEMLIPKSNHSFINKNIRRSFIEVLKLFEKTSTNGLNNPNLRRVLVDLIKWMENHLQSLKTVTNLEDLPKFLWYGPANHSQQYFLYFLYQLGLDCYIYDSTKEQSFIGLDKIPKIELENMAILPFPNERVQRASTVAYRAAREIDTMLQSEESVFFRPWALRDHLVQAITLKTTYDELFIMAKAQSFIRPNFNATNNKVNIPVVFGKIMGVSKNRKEYWDRFFEMTNQENSYLIKQFPILNETNSDFTLHYKNALTNNKLDLQKLMQGNYWSNFSRLPQAIQNTIAEGLIKTVESADLFLRVGNETQEELKIYIFKQVTRLPEQLVRMIQKYDFSKEVPKIILYLNEKTGYLSRCDSVLLLFLNKIGFDILIYNPTGHNDIEQFLVKNLYDIHWLDDMVFDLEIKEPSIKKRLTTIIKNLKGV